MFIVVSAIAIGLCISLTNTEKNNLKERKVTFEIEKPVFVEAETKTEDDFTNKIYKNDNTQFVKQQNNEKVKLDIETDILSNKHTKISHLLKSQRTYEFKSPLDPLTPSNANQPPSNFYEPLSYSGNCFIKMHSLLYDLSPLSNRNSTKYKVIIFTFNIGSITY